MQYKRAEKDNQIVRDFKEEVRINKNNQMQNYENENLKVQQKIKQREELRQEMLKVLELKRQQKIKAKANEYKHYL